MKEARAGHSAVRLPDGRVLVVGGSEFDTSCQAGSVAETFDPHSETWSLTDPLPIVLGRDVAAGVESGHALVVADGCRGLKRRAAAFDSTMNTWKIVSPPAPDWKPAHEGDVPTAVDPSLIARTGYSVTKLKNGSFLIAGGVDGYERTPAADIFVPEIRNEVVQVGLIHPGFVGMTSGVARISRTETVISECGPPFGATCIRHTFRLRARGIEPVIMDGGLPYWFLWPFGEIGSAGEGVAHAIHIDKAGHIWTVGQTGNTIEQFDATGLPLARLEAAADADGATSTHSFKAPTDVTWDAAGNIFVADSGHNRIVKYTSKGEYVAATDGLGSAAGQLSNPHAIASDATGNIYVADHGNGRLQVFDNNLRPKAAYDGIGKPWALCITTGSHQYLFASSNTEAQESLHNAFANPAEIYKLELDGTIIGKLRRPDDSRIRFQTPHALDCSVNGEILTVGLLSHLVVLR